MRVWGPGTERGTSLTNERGWKNHIYSSIINERMEAPHNPSVPSIALTGTGEADQGTGTGRGRIFLSFNPSRGRGMNGEETIREAAHCYLRISNPSLDVRRWSEKGESSYPINRPDKGMNAQLHLRI